MTADESKQPDRSEDSLGLTDLSMNEIAPATTAEPSEAGGRTSRAWLLVIGVVAVAAGLIWAFRTAVDTAPSPQVQQQLTQSVAAEPYGRDGTVQKISFLSGSKVRVDFSATIATASQKGRDRLRSATQGIMGKLVEIQSDRDLFLTGLQRDKVVVEARYRHRGLLVTSTGEKVPDISIRVQDDPEGGISGGLGNGMSGAGR